ncbi:TPA: hypothetical protein LT061_001607 [Salmonella enterica subsp. enterica serovar Blitta]|nr:hypothetical protein [Salmonella enterica subsp. enterica serovar Blitta]
MNNEAKILSLTPAVAGWWAKFTDETEWYSPVAAWALCRMSDDECRRYDVILPVLTSEKGITPHHEEDGYCELLYLPDEKFRMSGGEYCYAWVIADKQDNKS